MSEPDWLRLNRANWDERVAAHLAPESDYNTAGLHSGHYELHGIEEAELGPVAQLRLLHLQCHFGIDTLALAQRGANVTGLDFSGEAIAAARTLAAETGIKAEFVQSDVYAGREVLQGHFDRIYTTWGTIVWLPDIPSWAQTVASLLAPGGVFYFADMHPAAMVFDDETATSDKPGWFAPYFGNKAIVIDNVRDYANPTTTLKNTRTHEFIHPLATVVQSLLDAGLRLDMLHEHPTLAWKQFARMVETDGRLYRFPDQPWLPLSYSLKASKP